MNIIYFDNSATTKPYQDVIREVSECMEKYFGNPSSAHKLGIEAERKIKIARERVARIINAQPGEIIFTSGGSESNNTALRGLISKGDHIISTIIEHPSVINTLNDIREDGVDVTLVGVKRSGIVNTEELLNSVRENTKLVSIMHVNNEIGSIQPLQSIIKGIRERNRKTRIHVDGVQSLGKLNIDVKSLDIDLMSLSAHKIHGPKGLGAMYIKRGLKLKALISGGGQEMDIRSGTENVPGISGFGLACEIIYSKMSEGSKNVKRLKTHFIKRLGELEGVLINSPNDDEHIDNILNVSFSGVRGEVLLHALEEHSIYVSTGSACSAKREQRKNYVLPAIGLKACQIEGTIRFSFSYENTLDEVDYTVEALNSSLKFLRRI